jgi:rhamnose transport system permease protein
MAPVRMVERMGTDTVTEAPTTTAPAARSLNGFVARIAQARELGLLVVLGLIILFVGVQQPRFVDLNNFEHILQSVAIIAIIAVGETLVILTRNVDLSVGSIVGFSAYASASLLKDHRDLPLILVFLFGLALGAVLGAFNGLLVAYAGIPAIVVTLGTLYIYRGLDFTIAGGNEVSAYQVPTSFLDIAGAYVLGIPLLVIIAAVIAIIAGYLLRYSRQGRQLYAIGSNPDAARIIGIRKSRLVFSAFLISGALSGFAGVLWASFYATIDSGAASGWELLVIAAVVVGGVNIFGGSGTMLGAMLGAIVLGTIQNALGVLRVDQFWLQAIYGAAIIIAVTVDTLVTKQVQRFLVARRSRN